MADEQEEIFTVVCGGHTREVTRAQLAKAPDSLLSKILLNGEMRSSRTRSGGRKAKEPLVIPLEKDGPDCFAWRDGNENLFEACMDCYTGHTPSSDVFEAEDMPPATDLVPALRGFFDIPCQLWPLGARVASKNLEAEENLRAVAKHLLSECAKMMEESSKVP
ncbi:hypothetical protein WJX73_003311 [Symbiochloris irregularis]|uniref:Uncharacterized protein n=1 Tax=Symbiochloris irregularis TaxID=706552 RepID=A0AAW1PVA3_9CHLO